MSIVYRPGGFAGHNNPVEGNTRYTTLSFSGKNPARKEKRTEMIFLSILGLRSHLSGDKRQIQIPLKYAHNTRPAWNPGIIGLCEEIGNEKDQAPFEFSFAEEDP